MKKRLILIYILVCFALGVQTGFKTVKIVRDFKEGWDSVDNKETNQKSLFVDVYLKPDTAQMPTDSLYNKKSDVWMPAQIQSARVEVAGKEMSKTSMLVNGLSKMVLAITVLLLFLKLIVEVGSSKVFEWKNVTYLRIMGLGLLIIAVIDFTEYVHNLERIRDIIEIPGYRVIGDNLFDFMNLVLSLSAFLIAEVFAIGLRLKEEQDLTV